MPPRWREWQESYPRSGYCNQAKSAIRWCQPVGKTIDMDGESPPHSFRDPKDFSHLVGLDADLVRAAFACIGMPVDFYIGAWSSLLPAVIAGQADVMWDSLYYTPERA